VFEARSASLCSLAVTEFRELSTREDLTLPLGALHLGAPPRQGPTARVTSRSGPRRSAPPFASSAARQAEEAELEDSTPWQVQHSRSPPAAAQSIFQSGRSLGLTMGGSKIRHFYL